jgi:cyclohexadienyl dehydratase
VNFKLLKGGGIMRKRRSLSISTCIGGILLLLLSPFILGQAGAGERLERIMETKILRVGTPGDYRPFSMLDKESGNYEGHDIDLAKLLASEMGVEVEFVPTTWPNLMKDYQEDKYDIAVGGITQRVARVEVAAFLPPYAPNGKVALIRKEDKDLLTSLEAMDVPERTVIVNPGGTNEKFVNANFKNAKVQVHPENAEIPGMIAEGKGDIMITETFEAAVYARKDQRLEGAFMDNPLTRVSFMGVLIQKDDPDFMRVASFVWEQAKLRGDLESLSQEWLK